jgi:hypothetical protein
LYLLQFNFPGFASISFFSTATLSRQAIFANMVQSVAARSFPTIKDVRAFFVHGKAGGDYHDQAQGHWLIDSKISTPMSQYEKYRDSRTSWGINALGELTPVLCILTGLRFCNRLFLCRN